MKDFDIVAQFDQESKVIPFMKIFLGLFLLVAMMIHSHLDPSPLNLLWPDEGIHNWLGLPGALAAGFLIEIFGWCGILIPLFLLILGHKKTIPPWQAFVLDMAVVMLLTIGVAQLMITPMGNMARITGILGTISSTQLEPFPGRLITILLVVGFIVRYSKHFLLNFQFFLMIQNLGTLLFVLLIEFRKIGTKKLANWMDGLRNNFLHYRQHQNIK